jgi:hypothetical protein
MGSIIDIEQAKAKAATKKEYAVQVASAAAQLVMMAGALFETAVCLAMAGVWGEWARSVPEGTVRVISDARLASTKDPAILILLHVKQALLEAAEELAGENS